jgi:hypothetical protein
MAVSNNLKKQVDMPIWEWCRFAPAVSSALSCSCAADNSLYTVQHGRYIYYLNTATSFTRYDTITDGWQVLATPQVAPSSMTSMSFSGTAGYYSRVIAAPSTTTIQAALLTGNIFKGFDIRIIGGTGAGQQRNVSSVSDLTIADFGTASAGAIGSLTDANKNWQPNQWVGYQVKIVLYTGAVSSSVTSGGPIQTRKIMYNTATVLTFADNNKYPEDTWCNGPILASAPFAAPVAGSVYQIESSVLTVDSAFSPALDATSRFVIQTGGIWTASYQGTSMYSLQYYDIAADQWYIRTANTGPVNATPTDLTIQGFAEDATIWVRGVANGVVKGNTNSTTNLQDTTQNWTTGQWIGYYVRIVSGTGVGQLEPITANDATSVSWTNPGTAPDGTSYYTIEGFDAGTVSSATSCANLVSSNNASISGNVLTVAATITGGSFWPGMTLSGTGVSALYVVTNATTTSLGTTVTLTGGQTTTGIYVGMVMTKVSGTGTPATGITTVISVTTTTTFVISQAPTVDLANPNVFVLGGSAGATLYTSATATGANATITVGSTTNLVVGMGVIVTSGAGAFVSGTTVTAVNSGTTFTVSATPSSGLSSSSIVAVFPLTTYISNQLTGTPGGAGTYTVYPAQFVSTTTITGSGVATLTDTAKSAWTANRWNNQMVRITGGPGAGQTRSIIGTASQNLILSRDWMVQPTSSSTYVIHGDTDKILLSTGLAAPGMSAVFEYNIEADILTLGRALDYGVARGFSAQLLNTGQTYGDTTPIAGSAGTYTAAGGTINTTAGSVSGSNVTVTFSTTVFAVGSFVTVAGCTPSQYNGTYMVLASFAGSVTYTPSSIPTGAISIQGTIGQAATLQVGTVNPHNFITGQVVGLRGDTGTGAAVNNAASGYQIYVNGVSSFYMGLPSASANITQVTQSATRLADTSKNWVPNQWAGCIVTYNTVVVAQTTGIAAETSIQIAGNDSNSLYFVAASTQPLSGVSRYVITSPPYGFLKGTIGSLDAGTSVSGATANSTTLLVDVTKQWTSNALGCSSSGTNLITVSGVNTTAGLQVGMYVGVSAGAGTFTPGAAVGSYTMVTVTAVVSATTFTVSAIPATNLSSATVIATKWFPNAFVNRKLRITGSTGLNQELPISANTANSISWTTAGTAPVTGQSTYAILAAPGKGTGISMNWTFGQSDTTRRGSYIYLPRGNAVVGIDRLNMQTDTWELFQNSPGFETLTTGTMTAYDCVDRIYFTKEATMRVYYYDVDKNIINSAGIYPYTAGTAIIGNRMEIFTTQDGLKYLWLNRHSNTECFRVLLFY